MTLIQFDINIQLCVVGHIRFKLRSEPEADITYKIFERNLQLELLRSMELFSFLLV